MTYALPVADEVWSGERVTHLPERWLTSRSGEYFHLPRSAATNQWGLHVTALCGVSIRNPQFADEPNGLQCGTCLCGRRAQPFWLLTDPPTPPPHVALPPPAPTVDVPVVRRVEVAS